MTLKKGGPAFQEPELHQAEEQGYEIPECQRVRTDDRDNEAAPMLS